MSICVFSCPPQAGLIETNGELKVFIDQNLSPSKGERSVERRVGKECRARWSPDR